MNPIIRNAEDFTWVFIILLVIGVLLAVMKLIFYKSFSAIGSLKAFKSIEESTIGFALIVNIMLSVLAGLILYPFLQLPMLMMQESWMVVLFLMGAGATFILIKFLINAIISYFASERDEFKEIIRTQVYYRIYLLIVLLTITLLLYFSAMNKQYLLYAAVFSSVVVLLSEYYQQLNIGRLRKYVSSYYLILYLCILEILPVLYIYFHWYR
ncbi:DUF4271 domain-containing protein [Flavobacteriaceae bacterium Ap0902]|nr:DUF4271 domain-containing protein [Flavobacteriaceae bacterium Ap0902]